MSTLSTGMKLLDSSLTGQSASHKFIRLMLIVFVYRLHVQKAEKKKKRDCTGATGSEDDALRLKGSI